MLIFKIHLAYSSKIPFKKQPPAVLEAVVETMKTFYLINNLQAWELLFN